MSRSDYDLRLAHSSVRVALSTVDRCADLNTHLQEKSNT